MILDSRCSLTYKSGSGVDPEVGAQHVPPKLPKFHFLVKLTLEFNQQTNFIIQHVQLCLMMTSRVTTAVPLFPVRLFWPPQKTDWEWGYNWCCAEHLQLDKSTVGNRPKQKFRVQRHVHAPYLSITIADLIYNYSESYNIIYLALLSC